MMFIIYTYTSAALFSLRPGGHAAEVLPPLARPQVRAEGSAGHGAPPGVGASGGAAEEEREGGEDSSGV